MKKFFKVVFILIGGAILLIICAAGFIAVRGIPTYDVEKIELKVEATPDRIANGKKLGEYALRKVPYVT